QLRIEERYYKEPKTPEERLRGSVGELHRRRDEFVAWTRAPDFERLPQIDKDYVTNRIDELNEYLPYLEKVLKVPRPSLAQSLSDLQKTKELLEAPALEPPREEWKTTDAATLRREALEDAAALERAVENV